MFNERKYDMDEINDVNDLLRLLIETRYFNYRTNIYIQSQGVPIGGTISGLLAELVLQEAEKRIMNIKIEGLVGFY